MTVTVYSKPACVQCDATYRALDKHGVAYRTVDLTQDPAALELVRGLGYLQAPVVMAGDDHWSGYRPDKISVLAEPVAAVA
jgi:glutaredoxin-like protein NrdH